MADNEFTEEEIDELIAPKKNKPRGITATNTTASDNRKYLQHALESWGLPKVDFNKPETVRDRMTWYFNHCMENGMKPTISGLGNSLGVSRRYLSMIRHGQWKKDVPEVKELIDKAYGLMEELWEDYMQNGKVNPASGIFLGKNNFGYTDTQEVVLTPNNPLGDIQNQDDLRNKYLESMVVDDD